MKKSIRCLNGLFLILSLVGAGVYDQRGGQKIKALNAAVFAALGLINGVYALKLRRFNPLYMVLALLLGMTADIMLHYSFIGGALIFALGHGLYFTAFCCMEKLRLRDLLPGIVLFIPTELWLLLSPRFRFGSGLMEGICVGYALIISLMLGKALANFMRNRNMAYFLLVLGCGLFVFSDIMLVLNVFGRAPRWTDTACLYTYFSGQCITAHAMMYLAEGKNRINKGENYGKDYHV